MSPAITLPSRAGKREVSGEGSWEGRALASGKSPAMPFTFDGDYGAADNDMDSADATIASQAR